MLKIKLDTIDTTMFYINEHSLNNATVYLITPKLDVIWNPDNLIFRSSIWDKDGLPVSLSYKKFFNLDEQPTIDPYNKSLNGCSLPEKIDGSTLIVSNYNNNIIIRTRGTIDATKLPNGYEIPLLQSKYPGAFNPPLDTSYIFEWVSPTNQIVIKYPESDIYLTNVINHIDYSYTSQSYLNQIAFLLKVKRPTIYNFKSIVELIDVVSAFENIEGICIYYNNDQAIRKTKSIQYLKLHHFKNNLTVNNILELYLQWNRPSKCEFLNRIEKEFDYECRIMANDHIETFCNTIDNIEKTRINIKLFVDTIRDNDRKTIAMIIKDKFNTMEQGIAFTQLNNQTIKDLAFRNIFKYYN